MDYVWLLAGFVFLIKGADFLVDGAASLARRLNISDLVIGLTVVSFGTSTPELFVNVTASFSGNNQMAVGNIIGSNIANILLILGVASVIYPLTAGKGTVWREIPFCLLAMLVCAITANDRYLDGAMLSQFSRVDGLIFLSFFLIFLYYTFSIARDNNGIVQDIETASLPLPKAILWMVMGISGLGFGGDWVVKSATQIAIDWGMSQAMAGLTIVAIGTSLPELATSAMAAWKKQVEIAVGNVVGSNIFNVFLVLGVSATIRPIPYHLDQNMDMLMAVVASIMLFFFMFTGIRQRLDRWEGVIFLLVYFGYMTARIIYPSA